MEGGTNDDMIQKRFGLDIPVFVILQEKLEDILSKAPDWWGTSDKDIYDNLIFVMSPATAEIIAEKIGEPTKELEQISQWFLFTLPSVHQSNESTVFPFFSLVNKSRRGKPRRDGYR